MADRTFHGMQSLDRGVKTLFGVLTIGATGAVSASDCQGFAVTRTGVGAYTLTMEDRYPPSSDSTPKSPLLGVHATLLHATTSDGGKLEIVADNLLTAKTVTVRWVSDDASAGTFAPVEITEGAKLFLQVWLRNTSAPRKGI